MGCFRVLGLLALAIALTGPGSGTALALEHPSAVAPAPATIWPRLIGGMQLKGSERPEVRRFVREYTAHPETLEKMLGRSAPYLAFILDHAERRRLPSELVLLPAVESGWRPHAVSVSSAHGLWQFIPRTGAAYGLVRGTGVDERRDPVASTHAALDLLASLRREFRDWPLALAAYNAGGVRVRQAMAEGKSRDFWTLPLPPVTKDYVPRLLAIATIVREPARHGITLPAIDVLPHSPEAMKVAALQAAIETPAVDAISAIPAPPPAAAPAAAAVKPSTLSEPQAPLVAKPAPPAIMRRLARGMELSMRLGSAAVPASAPAPRAGSAAHALVADTTAPRARAKPAAKTVRAAGPNMHIVKKGDTLASIARRHRLSVGTLTALNPAVQESPLRLGQPLLLGD